MLRVLICGLINQEWKEELDGYLRLEGEGEQERDTGGNGVSLPGFYPTFVERERDLAKSVNRVNPQVIISLVQKPKYLMLMAHQDRLKWYHFQEIPDPVRLKTTVYEVYLAHSLFPHPGKRKMPLLSVFTPTYNSSGYLDRAYKSLSRQTYNNWEWIVVDDGSDDGTPEMVSSWAENDTRISFFRHGGSNLGNIGCMKHYAAGVCRGKYLVELDHDDMLTPDALSVVVQAFESDPGLGFVYSNFAEFMDDGKANYYPDWMDRGRYRKTECEGLIYLEALAYDIYGDVFGRGPVIKDMTVCPNHLRAFRRTELFRVGGYNPHLVMGDDYDLMIRMFCRSKVKHLPRLLYLYRYQENTWARHTRFARFIFPVILRRWENEIDARIDELKKRGVWLKEPQGKPVNDRK